MSQIPQPSDPDLDILRRTIRARTPARVLVGRAGPAYRTATQLELRRDHAAAIDAVREELSLDRAFITTWRLFEVQTMAASKAEFLMQPERGRHFDSAAIEEIALRCEEGADLQVVIGDGLSAAAVRAQVPGLLPLLAEGARDRGWRFGAPFVVRHCRVGILNEIGEQLDPAIVVLLIGERPGLATAESLSAYMAYRPRAGHTDAQRNLISNIHARGVATPDAARRILALAARMMQAQTSGVAVKEVLAECADPRSHALRQDASADRSAATSDSETQSVEESRSHAERGNEG